MQSSPLKIIVGDSNLTETVGEDRQKGNILCSSPKLKKIRRVDVTDMAKNPDDHVIKLQKQECQAIRHKTSQDDSMYNNFVTNTVSVVGIAVKEGQKLTGVELSPALFRKCGLLSVVEDLGWKIQDLGDITTADLKDKIDICTADQTIFKHTVENANVIGPMCHELSDIVNAGANRSDFNLILGGDHGLATGSISGMLRKYADLKVVWFDAHGDCNTPDTSPSGNYHGMPVAHLQGWIKKGEVRGFNWLEGVPILKPENIVYIGLRDVDPEEKKLLKDHNIKCYSPFDIEGAGGIGNVMKETLAYLKCDGKTEETKNPIHCSWDVDGCDPSFMSGTGTRARCGLTLRESHFILQSLYNTKNLVSLDMVEVNTLLEKTSDDRELLHGDIPHLKGQQTILYASELIMSGMGLSWL